MKTFLFSLTFALAAMFSGLALATPGNNGGGNGGCGVGQQTNGCGGTTTPGNGGAGGTVTGSGNSTNANTNLQGQGQAQGQAIIGSGNSTNRVNTASAANQSQTNAGNSLTGGSVSVSVEGAKGDVYVAPAQERAPVSTAYAPHVSPTALCALGISGGAQGASFGLSFGGSFTDENCVLLEQVRTTATVLGDRATAAEMMCGLAAYRAARERQGKPCQKTASAAAGGNEPSDPYVRRRLGLAQQ